MSVLILVAGSVFTAAAEATPAELLRSLQPTMVNPGDTHLQQLIAEACQSCHQEIYKQWKGSMHANSSALKDPIHGAMYRKVAGDPTKQGVTTKNGKPPICLNCHAPAAMEGSTKLDAKPVYNDGITCITCHSMETYKGTRTADGKLQLGVKAYTFSDMLHSPSGRNLGPMAAAPGGKGSRPFTLPVPPDRRSKQSAVDAVPAGEGGQDGFNPYPLKGGSAILRTFDPEFLRQDLCGERRRRCGLDQLQDPSHEG